MQVTLDEEYLTVAQAAALLQVSLSTLWRWINQGELPAYRVGQRRVRLRKADLARLITPARAQQEKGGAMAQQQRLGIRPLTREEQQRALAAIERLKHLQERLLARRGGKPFPASDTLINEQRDERTRQLQ